MRWEFSCRSCSLLVRVDLAAGEFARELSTGIVLLDVDEPKVAYVAFGETASVLVHAGLLETPTQSQRRNYHDETSNTIGAMHPAQLQSARFETPSGLLAQIEQRYASSRPAHVCPRFAAPRCLGLRAVLAVIRRARRDRTPWREVWISRLQ